MCKQFYFLLFLLGCAALGFAQKPNTSYRLPVTPDMPEWAKGLYRDDLETINVFQLDKEYKPWNETYLDLKAQMKKAGENASEDLKRQFEHYKQYYKYYSRWRFQVRPYVKPDGSLDFTIKTYQGSKPQAKQEAEFNPPPTWSHLGPVRTQGVQGGTATYQANIFSLDVAPSNSDIIYTGSESGVVNKSIDRGLNWTQVGADVFALASMRSIAIHPTNPDIVYLSDGGNIQTTADGGATWSVSLALNYANDIKIKPDDGEVVLAGGETLQRRTAGNVWTNVLNTNTYDIAFKPDDPSIVYVVVRNAALEECEFWKSTDGGLTFSVRSTGWSGLSNGGGRLSVTPADNNRVYAVVLTGGGPRVLRSNDAGETWTIIASSNDLGLTGGYSPVTGPLLMSNGQGYYDLDIVASHTNADHIIVGTTSTYKSTDGGVLYDNLGGYYGPIFGATIHADVQEMVAKGGDTWMACDGGIVYSTDFFTSVANTAARNNNVRGSEFWGFGTGWNEDVVVGGRYHNGNTAHRESWPVGDHIFVGGGEAATGYVNPGNPSLTYFSDLGGRILPATITGSVGSFTVSKFPGESAGAMQGGEQEWDPRYMYTYYLGQGNKLWKTSDNGLSFTSLFTSGANSLVHYIEVSRTNPDVIYITVEDYTGFTNGQLWKTTNGGTTWAQCNNPPTTTGDDRIYSKVTLSGTDANTLWWCFRNGPNGQKVFKSTDGGSSWTNWTTATLDGLAAYDIVHQLGTDGGVYFVSSTGAMVYYRDNTASDWTAYSAGLPVNIGNAGPLLARANYKVGKLRIAGAHGIWEAPFYTASTTTLVQPMADNAAPGCIRDTIQLESYSVVNGAATYQWSLSPAPQYISNVNIRNPRVVLGAPGPYSATLTVTDANGVTSRTITNFINNLPSGNLCVAEVVPGKALAVNGNYAYAQVSGNLNLNSNTVTMTAWVKRNGASEDFAGIVFASGGNTSSGMNMDNNNQLRYHWNGDGWQFDAGSVMLIPDNAWTHVALVVTPADATMYVNGVGATNTNANAIEEFDGPIRIGAQGADFRFFQGQIDEVTVWNTALTQNQIRELMHLTLIPAAQPNLKSYYQFNEPSGVAFDKVSTRHASLIGATRVVSTGPFGGGTSNRQTVTAGSAQAFPGTDVTLGFPAAGTYPDGEVVVSRINVVADSLPPGYAYHSDNHYWVIDNYGTNPTFTALDSMRLGNILVPGTHAVSPTSYQLTRRTANAHLLPWTLQPNTSIGANGGAAGRITFGTASGITQFGQFLPVNVNSCPINLAVNGVPILDGTYNADQEITSLGTVPGGGNVIFQSETALLQPNFGVTLGGVFTVVLLSCFP